MGVLTHTVRNKAQKNFYTKNDWMNGINTQRGINEVSHERKWTNKQSRFYMPTLDNYYICQVYWNVFFI